MKCLKYFLLLFSIAAFSQEEETSRFYKSLELSTPLRRNHEEETLTNEQHEPYWFLPDGLSLRGGAGMHYRKWAFLGIHSGIDWKAAEKIVAVPVFGNVKISPRLTKNDESRLFLNVGYGHAFALGRGDLSGRFARIAFGFQETGDSNFGFFIDLSHYDFPIAAQPNLSTISLGITGTFF